MRERLVICGLFSLMLAGCIIAASEPGPPPHVVAVAQPRLVIIPEADVYYAPDADVDLFFYGGFWYRWYGGAWYVASVHSGPWRVIVEPPEVFYRIPPGHAKHHVVQMRKAPPPGREKEEVGPRREKEEGRPRKEKEEVGPRKEKEEGRTTQREERGRTAQREGRGRTAQDALNLRHRERREVTQRSGSTEPA